MNLAVVLSKKKSRYGPMADALIKTSGQMNYAIRYKDDDVSRFKNIIFFDSRPHRFKDYRIKMNPHSTAAWWMNDLRDCGSISHEGLFPQMKYIFLCNREYMKDYESHFNRKVYFMPQHGHQFNYWDKIEYNDRVIFIGNLSHPVYHNNRREVLNRLRQFGLMIIQNQGTTYEMGDLYRKIPISLSISLPKQEYTSNRLYNILASGGFALVRYFPGIEKQFTNHRHLVWFETPDEAERLARYYINHPGKRKGIAEQGNRLYTEKHRAKNRIQNMYDIMEGKTEEFYGYK